MRMCGKGGRGEASRLGWQVLADQVLDRICESTKEVVVHSRGWGRRMDGPEPEARLLLSQTSSQTK